MARGIPTIFSEEQLEELRTLVASGMRQIDIAKHFHLTDDTIRKICRENDIQIRMPHKCVCVICGDTFYSNVKGAKTCKKEHHRTCIVCGKDFVVDRTAIRETCPGRCASIIKHGVSHPGQSEVVKAKRTATLIAKYGVSNPGAMTDHKEKAEKTMLEKYGASSWAGSEVGKKQTKETNMRKYGVEWSFASPEVREKGYQTQEEKYGDRYAMRTPEVKEKLRQTMLERYGVENPMQCPEIVERFRNNAFKKCGHYSYTQSEETKRRMSEHCMKKFGVPWPCMREEARKTSGAISKLNQAFESFLEENGIDCEHEFILGHYSYDFKCGNILIEINPTISHNSYMSIYKGVNPKDANYHLNKTKFAEENGFHCINIFDWDRWEDIISILKAKTVVFARKTTVVKISKELAEQFTNENHIQGSCRGQDIAYGLYEGDTLVQIITFGKPRYNKNYNLELLRLCTDANHLVVGGASKLFKAFRKDHPTESVISYCDYSKFSGEVYTKLGMTLLSVTSPAKVWSKNNEYVTDNLLRQRGFDQLFGTDYGKGTSNEELMIDAGWLPVYDCGQKVYISRLDQ